MIGCDLYPSTLLAAFGPDALIVGAGIAIAAVAYGVSCLVVRGAKAAVRWARNHAGGPLWLLALAVLVAGAGCGRRAPAGAYCAEQCAPLPVQQVHVDTLLGPSCACLPTPCLESRP